MAGVSGGLLAAETCRAGAMGFVAAGHANGLDSLDHEIALFHKHAPPNSPLALGFISHSACKGGDFTTLEKVLQTYEPQYVQFFAPAIMTSPTSSRTNIDVAKEYNAQVLVQVGNISDAKVALESGADAIIAQGSEAGGHGLRKDVGSGTFSLAGRIAQLSRESTNVPVLAAGGMVDGHSLAAALALGCDGIVLGTRLWASHEGMGLEQHKEKLTKAEADDCLRTNVVDQIANSYTPTPWPYPYDSVGILKNLLTDEWNEKPPEELTAVMDIVAPRYRQAVAEGDTSLGHVYAGEGVGCISSIDGAYDIIQGIHYDAVKIVTSMPNFLQNYN